MIQRRKIIQTSKVKVKVIQEDIDGAECLRATRCMERVAIFKALKIAFPKQASNTFHVRVDAGHIKFNVAGYRWLADTPKIAKDNLILFDRDKSKVRPHSYTIVAVL